jgi:hypothetical protein
MQLTPLLALAGMAGIALSNPIATPTPDDTDAGAVYRCDGQGWVNNCLLITDPTNCHNRMTSLGSFGPDKGLSCTMFENRVCTGRVATISYPGVGYMWDWENKSGFIVNSWQCRWTL